MHNPIPYLGETLALLTAVVWAVAVILFKKSGEKVHPQGLNLFKDFLSFFLIIPTMWVFGETFFRDAPASDYALLFLSGALGIGFGDTLFFMSLNLVGAGLTAIISCLYSPFIIALSILFLGERLSFLQFVGVTLIISAVLTTLGKNNHGEHQRKKIALGILFGALANACTAIGVVIVKPILARAPLLWVTEMRLVGGIIVLFLFLLFNPGRSQILKPVMNFRSWVYTISGSFAGAYVSMIIWLAAMQLTQASVASALNQTSNIFVFLFAVLFLREPLDRLRILGVILGVGGSLLVTFG